MTSWNKKEPWNKKKPRNEGCTQAADTKREQDEADALADAVNALHEGFKKMPKKKYEAMMKKYRNTEIKIKKAMEAKGKTYNLKWEIIDEVQNEND